MNVTGLPDLPPDGVDLRQVIREISLHWIEQAMERTNASATRASRLLGMTRTAVIERLRSAGKWEKWKREDNGMANRCTKCKSRGWVEEYYGGSASWTPRLAQCPNRCNISGYSDEVSRRLNNPDHVTESPVLAAVPSDTPNANVIALRRPVVPPRV